MDRLDELMAQCVASPDNDAPRLVWADAVGGERGELVALQCRLASGGVRDRDEWRALRARERELISGHGVAWSDLEEEHPCWRVFRRGFVDAYEIVCSHDARLDPIFAATPLARSKANNFLGEDDWDLARHLANPRSTDFAALRLGGRSVERAIELLIERGVTLRALSVESLTPAGVDRLVDSGLLAKLERLSLGTVPNVARVVAAAPRLRALHVWSALETYAAIIPQTVVELGCRVVDIETVARLAIAPSLLRLRVESQGLAWEAEILEAFRALRSLDLSRATPDPRHRAFSLDRSGILPSLRELSLGTAYDLAALGPVARTLGSQLDTLHWSGPIPRDLNPAVLAAPLVPGDASVATLVDGEFVVGLRPPWSRRPLEYGDDVHAPWFEGGVS